MYDHSAPGWCNIRYQFYLDALFKATTNWQELYDKFIALSFHSMEPFQYKSGVTHNNLWSHLPWDDELFFGKYNIIF